MSSIVNRFIKYTKYNTKSMENSNSFPSTSNQLVFAKILKKELEEIGLVNVILDKNGYLMATLPANTDKDIPTIGFIAHMDTSPAMSGANVNPQIIDNYNGKDIYLNKERNIILSPEAFPELKQYIGETLITTDGTTLLGADNKAGIAEIITSVEYLIKNPHIKHGEIKIAFTPDEEIGKGADHFNVKKFGADFAYTVDGGPIGELEYENFNATNAKITIHGQNVHPGSAKNKMLNSMLVAMEFNSMLPSNEKPEYTEGYEGFFHLISMRGSVEKTSLKYIIRDHDKNMFENKKETIKRTVDYLNYKYGKSTVKFDLNDKYYNMKEKIEPVMHIVHTAKKAMEEVDVTPNLTPVRGGTDGARLSFMGLPCPNIFTGGHNFHGKYEFIPVFAMKKAVEVIVKIIELYAI